MMTHQKHNKLPKPAQGLYARREWAVLGTACGTIQQLARALAERLSPRLNVAYLDADHRAGDEGLEEKNYFAAEYTDKIGFHRLDFQGARSPWQWRALFNDADLALINGNHFEGARQIVALDRRKFESLARKLKRLTAVDLFLTKQGDPNFVGKAELPDFLKTHLPGWADIPTLDISDVDSVAVFIREQTPPPPLRALILAGGQSVRMGQNKADLDYHGRPQWLYLRHLLDDLGLETSVSCRPEQAGTFGMSHEITDAFAGLGPMGAILSALQQAPDAAWMVLACDLPLLDKPALQFLIDRRNPAATATCFRQPPAPEGWDFGKAAQEEGFPEPLISIWEPKSYMTLLQFLAQGVSCPRKVLLNSNTHLLDAPNPEVLLNANTPEEREKILEKIAINHTFS
jgi:molybdenum cofactor guanylyltransferase